MSNKLPELIKVAHSSLGISQSLDVSGNLLSPLVRVEISKLLLVLSVVPLLLHEWVMDELVIQELIKDIELLYQELVECVNDCSHHTDSMSLDRVEHLIYSYRLYLFCLSCDLNEHLGMDVVTVFTHKLTQVSQELKDIDSLLKLLSWQMTLNDIHLELLFCENSHVLIGLEIVRCQCRHLVEDLTKVMFYLFFDTYLLLE